MTIAALAIESNISLSNLIVVADNPQDAVEKLVRSLEMFDGEEIQLICVDVLRDGTISEEDAGHFRHEVERRFEQAVPELFVQGYFEDAE